MSAVSEVLLASLSLLENKGWIQGAMATNNGYCALGAIKAVCWNRNMPIELPMKALKRVTKREIISWNDSSTKEEVLAAFRKAIENEKCL